MTRTAVLSNPTRGGGLHSNIPRLGKPLSLSLLLFRKKDTTCILFQEKPPCGLFVAFLLAFLFPIGYHKPLKRLLVSLFDPENKIFSLFFFS
jgi:hypothetical protein